MEFTVIGIIAQLADGMMLLHNNLRVAHLHRILKWQAEATSGKLQWPLLLSDDN